jgi:hypothetical protein
MSLICILLQAYVTLYLGNYNAGLYDIIPIRAGHGMGELILPALFIVYYFIDKERYTILLIIAAYLLIFGTYTWKDMSIT